MEPDRRESSGFEGRVIVFKHAGTAGGSGGVQAMRHIRDNVIRDKIRDLHKYAEKTYALGQRTPTQEFDSAVGHLILYWDDLCNLLEEHGRQAAERRETVSVEGLHEALSMMEAAVYAIDSARRHHMWEYRGDLPNEHECFQHDVNVEGLSTLKRRFNAFMEQERRYRRVEIIVRETLEDRFKGTFVFDPVLAVPAIDEFGGGDGSAYLRIVIIFDGDRKQLDPGWTSGLIGRIEPKLIDAGIEEFPSPSFIEKSEWLSLNRKRRSPHHEASGATA